MVKWIVVMKIQPSICLDDWGKPRKNLSQVGRHRDLNQGPPEYESNVFSLRHLACFVFIMEKYILFYFYEHFNSDEILEQFRVKAQKVCDDGVLICNINLLKIWFSDQGLCWKFGFQIEDVCWLDVKLKEKNSVLDRAFSFPC